MDAGGADADFGAEPELVPVVESRRRIHKDRGGVYVLEELRGVRLVLRDDRLGVLRAVPGDVVERLIKVCHHLHGKDQVQKFRPPIRFGGRRDARRKRGGLRATADFHPRLAIACEQGRQERGSDLLMHQQCLHGVAGARPLDLCVETDLRRHRQVRIRIHIGVADTLIVFDDGNGGLARDEAHQALAPSGNDHIDERVLLEQQRRNAAVGIVNECDGARGYAGFLAGLYQHADDGGVRLDGLGAAAEDHRISGFQAQ